jgi:hypothetical protein
MNPIDLRPDREPWCDQQFMASVPRAEPRGRLISRLESCDTSNARNPPKGSQFPW